MSGKLLYLDLSLMLQDGLMLSIFSALTASISIKNVFIIKILLVWKDVYFLIVRAHQPFKKIYPLPIERRNSPLILIIKRLKEFHEPVANISEQVWVFPRHPNRSNLASCTSFQTPGDRHPRTSLTSTIPYLPNIPTHD